MHNDYRTQTIDPPIRRAILVVSLLAVIAVTSPVISLAAEPKPAVRLVIDFGDGVQIHFTDLAWREGMVVVDALSAAQAHKRGVPFVQRGSGSSAMITKIGDQTNQGGGGQSKNWMYYVNDKAGEVSAGIQKLKPSDAVLWKFQADDYNR